jgi:hypothetical protein
MKKIRAGFTLTELAIAGVTSAMVVIATGVAIAQSMKDFNTEYNSVFASVRQNSYAAQRRFEAITRKASGTPVCPDGTYLTVNYFSSSSVTTPDLYAKFYISSGSLMIEYGTIPASSTTTETVCGNVTDKKFSISGTSAAMELTLNDGTQTITTITAAELHN